MQIKKGDRLYSEEYQRVIVVAETAKSDQNEISIWHAITPKIGFWTRRPYKGRRFVIDTSGIIYPAASFVPFHGGA